MQVIELEFAADKNPKADQAEWNKHDKSNCFELIRQ